MSVPLLLTKLHIPSLRPTLVSRRDLVGRIKDGMKGGSRLTLISAPAGFGKTTLLAEWACEAGRPVAWLSLEESDNDLSRFLSYFTAALRSLLPEGAWRDIELLEAAPYPADDAILTPLLNHLIELDREIAVVLDDYQAIDAQAIHEALAFLVNHLPAQVHLVIATRVDPPLPLSRWRGRGQLTEIRAADLRFTPDEALTFLNECMGLSISGESAALLGARTEGWIAGLQLAALSLQHQPDPVVFITSFSGSDRFIADYLLDEVLSKQTDSVKGFLLQTSILDQLTGPLCDALTGQQNSHLMLEELVGRNLFLSPLDSGRTWYRYHHLFRDLLRVRLQELDATRVRDLHTRAAHWYEQHGLTAQAMNHALAAPDYELAADVLARLGRGVELWRYIDIALLLKWLSIIPDHFLDRRPWVRLYAARAHAHAGQFDAAETLLADVDRTLGATPETIPDAAALADQVAVNRVVFAAFRGQTRQAIDFAQRVLDREPPIEPLLRIRAVRALAYAYYHLGDLDRANEAMEQSIVLADSSGMVSASVGDRTRLALNQIEQGRLRLALRTCEEAERRGLQDGKRIPAAGLPGLAISEILYEHNQIEAAVERLSTDLRFLGQHQITDYIGSGYALLARGKQVLGEAQAASLAMEQAVAIAIASGVKLYQGRIAAHQARLWLMQGRTERAARWAREYQRSPATEYLRELEDLALVRVLLAVDRPREGLAVLDRLLPAAEEGGRLSRVIEGLALRALALQASGSQDKALRSLERALHLGEPEGYLRLFVDLGQPVARLMATAEQVGCLPDYGRRILSACGRQPFATSAFAPDLTRRELQVLRYLATGLTVPEIAEEMVVAVSTVRSHVKNIYGKLGVSSRYEAVRCARALQVL